MKRSREEILRGTQAKPPSFSDLRLLFGVPVQHLRPLYPFLFFVILSGPEFRLGTPEPAQLLRIIKSDVFPPLIWIMFSN